MARLTVCILLSLFISALLAPWMTRPAAAYAEDRLMPTAAIVPPTYTPVPATATAEPLPTAQPTATAEALVIPPTAVPTSAVATGSEARSQEPSAPVATAAAATAAPQPTAAPAQDTHTQTDAPAAQPVAQPATSDAAPVIQPTAIILPTPAQLQPLTKPISQNPALQSSTGIVNSLHVWGTQPLVMLMLICGFAGVGFLYYGQKN